MNFFAEISFIYQIIELLISSIFSTTFKSILTMYTAVTAVLKTNRYYACIQHTFIYTSKLQSL